LDNRKAKRWTRKTAKKTYSKGRIKQRTKRNTRKNSQKTWNEQKRNIEDSTNGLCKKHKSYYRKNAQEVIIRFYLNEIVLKSV